MKGKTLGILLIAALLLGGAGYLASQREAAGFTQSKLGMGAKVLGEFDPNTVGTLRLTAGTNQLRVTRKGDVWVVAERGDYPANFSTLADFLRKLTDLKVTRPVEAGPSRFPALDLVDPAQGAGVRLELLGADGKTLQSLLLGKKHSKGGEDSSPMGGGGFPDGRYVLVEGASKSVALVSDALSNAEPRPEEWLNKDFLKVELPRVIEVVRAVATNSFRLTRTNEFAEWQLDGLTGDEKLDPAKTGQFGTVLSSPSFNDVVVNPDLAALGLDQPTLVRIETTTGFKYEFKLGKPQANEDYPVQVTVTAQLPEAPKDEKPEDKEKRLKLAEKLSAEQGYGKYTYLVAKWTLDAVLKNRGELLVDKNAPKAPEGAGAPPGFPGLQGIPGLPGLPGQ